MVKTGVSGGTSMKNKKTKGKRKIDIKKIEEIHSRHVTFSKRRTGLFKKAAEMCVMTGAEIAILITSSGGREFAFGNPNADVVADRYLNNNDATGADSATTQNSPPPLPMEEFNRHYLEVLMELEAEKNRGETIPVSSGGLRWYEEPVNGLDVEELLGYLWSLAELKKKVLTRADEQMKIEKSSAFFGYNSIQPVDIPINAAVDGGFYVQYVGDGGNF